MAIEPKKKEPEIMPPVRDVDPKPEPEELPPNEDLPEMPAPTRDGIESLS
jgi:hypothetical protein